MAFFSLFGNDLAIDLGSSNTRVYKKNKGIVLEEASQLLLNIENGEVVAVGNKVREIEGKSPQNYTIINPLEKGVISDFDFTKILIKYFIEKANQGFNIIQPKVLITIPSGSSDIELKAIEDACIYSGAREVYIVESPLSSAFGGGIDISKSTGRFIVNVGAGNTDIAILSMNGIVLSKNIKIGGNQFDLDIQNFVLEKYLLDVDIYTIKKIKEEYSSLDLNEDEDIEITGRDLTTGMPKAINIKKSDIYNSIIEHIYEIIDSIKYIIEKIPPEFSRDILTYGIFLTGSSSLIQGFDKLIEETTGIKIEKSINPSLDNISGAGKILENLEKFKKIGL